jgi:hypothetical protein
MKPLPPNGELFQEATTLLLDCYREPMTRACRRALVLLANKNGSVGLEQVAKAVRLPKALKSQVLAAVPGPLLDLGLIRPVRPTQSACPGEQAPFDNRFEIVDQEACFRWLIGSLSSPTSGTPVPSARPADQ